MNKKGWTLVIVLILLIGGVSILMINGSEETDPDTDDNEAEEMEYELDDEESDEDVKSDETEDVGLDEEGEDVLDSELTMNYTASYFGYGNTIQIFEDRTFLITDDRGGMIDPESSEEVCYKGKISIDDQKEIVDLIKSIGFLDMEMEQEDDMTMVCEGTVSLKVGIDSISNSVRMPCVAEHTEHTEEIGQAISDIRYKVKDEILEPIKVTCDSR